MVEMLGVLAIIGVLSVGGIAGYTKAMRMYRSNLQQQQLSELLSAMVQIQPNLNPRQDRESIAQVFASLNLLPKGMTYDGGSIIHDNFGHSIRIFSGLNLYYCTIFDIPFENNKLTKESEDYCHNVFLVVKKNIKHIRYIQRVTNHASPTQVYSDRIKTYTMQQIRQFCTLPKGAPSFQIYIQLVP